jgi:hypothetical protein
LSSLRERDEAHGPIDDAKIAQASAQQFRQ